MAAHDSLISVAPPLLRMDAMGVAGARPQYRCDTCKEFYADSGHLKQHLASDRHKRAVAHGGPVARKRKRSSSRAHAKRPAAPIKPAAAAAKTPAATAAAPATAAERPGATRTRRTDAAPSAEDVVVVAANAKVSAEKDTMDVDKNEEEEEEVLDEDEDDEDEDEPPTKRARTAAAAAAQPRAPDLHADPSTSSKSGSSSGSGARDRSDVPETLGGFTLDYLTGAAADGQESRIVRASELLRVVRERNEAHAHWTEQLRVAQEASNKNAADANKFLAAQKASHAKLAQNEEKIKAAQSKIEAAQAELDEARRAYETQQKACASVDAKVAGQHDTDAAIAASLQTVKDQAADAKAALDRANAELEAFKMSDPLVEPLVAQLAQPIDPMSPVDARRSRQIELLRSLAGDPTAAEAAAMAVAAVPAPSAMYAADPNLRIGETLEVRSRMPQKHATAQCGLCHQPLAGAHAVYVTETCKHVYHPNCVVNAARVLPANLSRLVRHMHWPCATCPADARRDIKLDHGKTIVIRALPPLPPLQQQQQAPQPEASSQGVI